MGALALGGQPPAEARTPRQSGGRRRCTPPAVSDRCRGDAISEFLRATSPSIQSWRRAAARSSWSADEAKRRRQRFFVSRACASTVVVEFRGTSELVQGRGARGFETAEAAQ